jgi:hypothetical protein
MDKQTAQELIAVIDSKIASLQRAKDEILQLIGKHKDEGMVAVPTKPSDSFFGDSSESTRKIYEILSKAGKGMGPKELFVLLRENGLDLPEPRVRQILRRWKGRLFESKKRGTWKAIRQD